MFTNVNQSTLAQQQAYSSQGVMLNQGSHLQQIPLSAPNHGLPLTQQPMYAQQPTLLSQQQPMFVQQQPIMQQQMPMMQQQMPMMQQQMPMMQSGLQPVNMMPAQTAVKTKKGHHHGLRKKRSTAVIPSAVIPIGQPMMQQQTHIIQQQVPMMQQAPIMRAAPMSVPVEHETVMRPAQVIETIRTDRVVEIQPVVHRDIDQTVVHHVEQHITEAPAANRGGVVQMAPIIQQTIVRHEIDEIQPVVHRELANSVVERIEEHTSERLVAPTQHTSEVVHETPMMMQSSLSGDQSAQKMSILDKGRAMLHMNQQANTVNQPIVNQQAF